MPLRRFIIALFTTALAGTAAFAADKAPDFSLKDVDGKTHKLSKLLKEGPILLDFWATWCKPCLEELPMIEKIEQAYRKDGLRVVAVSVDNTKSRSKVKPLIKAEGWDNFLVLLDETMEVRRLFGGTTMPFTALIAPSGEILYSHVGYVPGDEKKLEAAVAAYFGKEPSVTEPAGESTPSAADE